MSEREGKIEYTSAKNFPLEHETFHNQLHYPIHFINPPKKFSI